MAPPMTGGPDVPSAESGTGCHEDGEVGGVVHSVVRADSIGTDIADTYSASNGT